MEVENKVEQQTPGDSSVKVLEEADVDDMKKYVCGIDPKSEMQIGPYVLEIQEMEKKIKDLEGEVTRTVGRD